MNTNTKPILLIILTLTYITNIPAKTLSDIHPEDKNIGSSPKVLLHEDFENGWEKWKSPSSNTQFLFIENTDNVAHTGHNFLRSTVTAKDLKADPYISAKSRYIFDTPADSIYWRFYTRFNLYSPTPHHWVKLAATNGTFDVRGKAGIKPDGDEAVWLDIDINNNDLFSFFVYWHNMRSGRCNDGSTTPGCDGDQGKTYYYGNKFKPAGQTPMQRDEWFCIEIHAKLNDIGEDNGELSLWVNNKLVGNYKKGTPTGAWFRSRFHSDGCKFNSCPEPSPFDGFNFRTSENVKFREIYMDAYYQLDTFNRKKNKLEKMGKKVSENLTIFYDDIIVATERIGCMSSTRR